MRWGSTSRFALVIHSTLDERIREHEAKILVERELHQPNEGRIRHWEAEIRAFRSAIDRARKRLGGMR